MFENMIRLYKDETAHGLVVSFDGFETTLHRPCTPPPLPTAPRWPLNLPQQQVGEPNGREEATEGNQEHAQSTVLSDVPLPPFPSDEIGLIFRQFYPQIPQEQVNVCPSSLRYSLTLYHAD